MAPSETSPRKGKAKWWIALAILVAALASGYGYHHFSNLTFNMGVPDRPVRNAPYVPTPQNVVDEMLDLVNVTKDDLLYDLGCGDGRIVITAAKRFGCRAVGFEINPELIERAQQLAKDAGVEHLVSIEKKDVFELDLTEPTVVTIYLLPLMNKQLAPQLCEMKPGSRIVTHDFGIEGYQPDKTVLINVPQSTDHRIHVWYRPLSDTKIPPKKSDK